MQSLFVRVLLDLVNQTAISNLLNMLAIRKLRADGLVAFAAANEQRGILLFFQPLARMAGHGIDFIIRLCLHSAQTHRYKAWLDEQIAY
jgi:hypothetical protein